MQDIIPNHARQEGDVLQGGDPHSLMGLIWSSFVNRVRLFHTGDGMSFAFAFFNMTVTNELEYFDTSSLSLLFGSVVAISVSITPARISLSGRLNPRSSKGISCAKWKVNQSIR